MILTIVSILKGGLIGLSIGLLFHLLKLAFKKQKWVFTEALKVIGQGFLFGCLGVVVFYYAGLFIQAYTKNIWLVLAFQMVVCFLVGWALKALWERLRGKKGEEKKINPAEA